MPCARAFLFLLLWPALFALSAAGADHERTAQMPDGFVYLRDVDPSIPQEMRYAGPHNFTGWPVPGYNAAECVLVREAAEALKAIQTELRPEGLSLKIYDCYRPQRAIAAFVAWAKEPDDQDAKRAYYPALSKDALFPGYIATRSSHSRGATADVTLVKRNPDDETVHEPIDQGCANVTSAERTVDMGVGFDCFDLRANSKTDGLTETQRRNRQRLLEVMAAHGFQNYPKEIWHYTFQPEPYPDRYFDFPIAPRPGSDSQR